MTTIIEQLEDTFNNPVECCSDCEWKHITALLDSLEFRINPYHLEQLLQNRRITPSIRQEITGRMTSGLEGELKK
jgi:hypothetical protein